MSPRATPWGTYTRIAETLRERIISGTLAVGQALPSESALSAEFGVARSTLRRALAKLEADMLVRSVPGTGRVVCDPSDQTSIAGPRQPQYRTIAAKIQERIANGTLVPGAPVPSEAAIVREYSVSRGTARQALSELEGSGLIMSQQGKGRFVSDL